MQAGLLGDLINGLNSTETASEFCKTMVHFVLKEEQAVAAYLLKLTEDSRLKLIGSYGYPSRDVDSFNVSVWDPAPHATAVRSGQPVVNNSDDKQELLIPIKRSLGPIGCLGIGFRSAVGSQLLDEDAQWAFQLAGSASLNRFGSTDKSPNTQGDAPALSLSLQTVLDGLTKRQLVILEHISEQRTNAYIARLMNLSESAIKKEVISIFKLLAVTSRADARKIAIQFGIVKPGALVVVADALTA
jgi:DNA-binding CsgD family transcriptional regulator